VGLMLGGFVGAVVGLRVEGRLVVGLRVVGLRVVGRDVGVAGPTGWSVVGMGVVGSTVEGRLVGSFRSECGNECSEEESQICMQQDSKRPLLGGSPLLEK
jgi:hypothetical protein